MSANYEPWLPPGAHARNSDPETSHWAAASLPGDRIRASQLAVLRVIRRLGQATDTDIIAEFDQLVEMGYETAQSPSGIRTRRSELVALDEVFDTGTRRTLASGRRSIVWMATPKFHIEEKSHG